jgi:DNA-binding FadR family transcriptional regulator
VSDFPQLSSRPQHQTVQEEIRHYIVRNGLRAGDPLRPEAELARLFGVSRNSIREAVKGLESAGILETRRGSGVFVREFSFAPLLDQLPYGLMQGTKALSELLALRKVLETALIEDAMRALRPQSLEALQAVLAQAKERAERDETFADQDRDFHRLLFADLGNEMLLRLFDLFWVAFNRAAPPSYGQTPMDSYQWHADIVEAVISGDSERARTAVREHYVGLEQRIEATRQDAAGGQA